MPKLCLLGYPLEHSLSPAIHNAAFREAGLEDWQYELLPAPPEALPAALQRLREADCLGGNVTLPHKETVIPYLDGLTPAAQAIGAVNTLFKAGEALLGDNTDAAGFWQDLQRVFGSLPAGEALVLGAGGAARAVVYALMRRGWQVTVAARRGEQAASLARTARAWGEAAPHALPLEEVGAWHPRGESLIVNCTPAGMHPHPETSPWPPKTPFPRRARLYDLVYNPARTALVRRAQAAGLPAATGYGMLLAQAALAFHRWKGAIPP